MSLLVLDYLNLMKRQHVKCFLSCCPIVFDKATKNQAESATQMNLTVKIKRLIFPIGL